MADFTGSQGWITGGYHWVHMGISYAISFNHWWTCGGYMRYRYKQRIAIFCLTHVFVLSCLIRIFNGHCTSLQQDYWRFPHGDILIYFVGRDDNGWDNWQLIDHHRIYTLRIPLVIQHSYCTWPSRNDVSFPIKKSDLGDSETQWNTWGFNHHFMGTVWWTQQQANFF